MRIEPRAPAYKAILSDGATTVKTIANKAQWGKLRIVRSAHPTATDWNQKLSTKL